MEWKTRGKNVITLTAMYFSVFYTISNRTVKLKRQIRKKK